MGNLLRIIAPKLWFCSFLKDTKGMAALVFISKYLSTRGMTVIDSSSLHWNLLGRDFMLADMLSTPLFFFLSIICNSMLTLIYNLVYVCLTVLIYFLCKQQIFFCPVPYLQFFSCTLGFLAMESLVCA